MSVTYTYSHNNDFVGLTESVVHSDALREEILATSIVPSVENVHVRVTSTDNVDIIFDDALSVNEVIELDAVIAAHTGVYTIDVPNNYDTISSIVTASTNSADFVSALSGGYVTVPVDGYYFSIFGTEVSSSNIDTDIEIGIGLNSANVVSGTEREVEVSGAGEYSSATTTSVLGPLVTGDKIYALFRRSAGSGTVYCSKRRLTIIKV